MQIGGEIKMSEQEMSKVISEYLSVSVEDSAGYPDYEDLKWSEHENYRDYSDWMSP